MSCATLIRKENSVIKNFFISKERAGHSFDSRRLLGIHKYVFSRPQCTHGTISVEIPTDLRTLQSRVSVKSLHSTNSKVESVESCAKARKQVDRVKNIVRMFTK